MIFTIKKGKHNSNNILYKLINFFNFKKELTYKVTFSDNCLYVDNTIDKFDINKLFGFSVGYHHKNSARFGWNCQDGEITIFAYCYVNGERDYKKITTVKTNKEYTFKIVNMGIYYFFQITDDSSSIEIIIVNEMTSSIGYKLWPYFGGNNKVPHTMNIKMIQV